MLKAKKFKSIICLLPKKTSQFVLIIFLVLFIGLSFETDFAIGETHRVSFNDDIRPILSDKCYACHGPDKKKRKADLQLDIKESAFADRGGYFAVVPGKLLDSALFQRITAEDPKDRMPPL
ncbi:TPA: hypothetical protein EYM26_18280, partial [Candidatus Poribacteria bacterium]|nr:hypothetical protein [Candidatus Poribacteria bacterium]